MCKLSLYSERIPTGVDFLSLLACFVCISLGGLSRREMPTTVPVAQKLHHTHNGGVFLHNEHNHSTCHTVKMGLLSFQVVFLAHVEVQFLKKKFWGQNAAHLGHTIDFYCKI